MSVTHLYLISGLSHLVPNSYHSAYTTLQELTASLEPGRFLKNRFIEKWHAFCWNLSIPLLQSGNFELGWQLYAHGTLVAAGGKQRWQRSFPRYFSSSQVPVWDGHDLTNSTLLIYGEQGIGDTMMFLRLIPAFVQKYNPSKIVIAPGNRLVPLFHGIFPSCEILEGDNT